jgi:hypothetical protein
MKCAADACALAMAVALAATCAWGGIVTTLPDPDADGWYVFGDPAFADANVFPKAYIQNMVYPKWSEMTIPAGAKIKLVGGIVMDKGLPEAATIDMSTVKFMVMINQGAFGARTITVNSGTYFRASFGTVTENNGVLSQSISGTTVTNDVVMNGTLRQSDSTPANIYFTGSFTGSGRIESDNFGKSLYFRGPFGFTGNNSWGSNYGGSIRIETPYITGRWSSFYVSGSGDTWQYNSSYFGSRLVYNPPRRADGSPADKMLFGTLNGYASVVFWSNGQRARACGAICFWGGNTVHARTLQGSLHFVPDSAPNRTTRDTATSGYGTLEADTVSGAVAYLSTNMNMVAGTVTGNARFDYTAESNAVNTATLRITNSCVATASVKASNVLMLPSVMKGLNAASPVQLVARVAGGETYPMPLDFTADVVNPAGCDGSGTLDSAPETGTIAVTFPVGPGAPKPERGRIPLAVFDAGGAKLANWTVTLNGSSEPIAAVRNMMLEVVKDETGIWLDAKQGGATIIFR